MNDFSPIPASIDEIASKFGDVDKDFIASQLSYWVKRGIILKTKSHGTTYYAINEDQRNNKTEYVIMDEVVLSRNL